MSKKKNGDSLITDETTLMRRAWVDLALDSVRSQLDFRSHENGDLLAAGYEGNASERRAESSDRARRHLYLAYSAGKTKAG
jgi:hypothetical protein